MNNRRKILLLENSHKLQFERNSTAAARGFTTPKLNSDICASNRPPNSFRSHMLNNSYDDRRTLFTCKLQYVRSNAFDRNNRKFII
jgi:hypothetical protein